MRFSIMKHQSRLRVSCSSNIVIDPVANIWYSGCNNGPVGHHPSQLGHILNRQEGVIVVYVVQPRRSIYSTSHSFDRALHTFFGDVVVSGDVITNASFLNCLHDWFLGISCNWWSATQT